MHIRKQATCMCMCPDVSSNGERKYFENRTFGRGR